ncbi:MAG TPA: hypothetical protein VHH36_05275 [Candidatus Thermoplasmatota archaeon]|nr:hypothetical protein [Candidatus Thermoplasmatota archaeon]
MSHLKDSLDPAFLRRQWRVQRLGWLAMAAVVAATVLGLFGTSTLAYRVARVEADGATYEVEYPRVTRYQHADRLHLRVHAPGAAGDALRVAFSPSFVANAHVLSAFPEPDGGGAGPGGAVYEYKVEDWSTTVVVTFEYESLKAFAWEGSIQVTAGDAAPVSLPLPQWVHP